MTDTSNNLESCVTLCSSNVSVLSATDQSQRLPSTDGNIMLIRYMDTAVY